MSYLIQHFNSDLISEEIEKNKNNQYEDPLLNDSKPLTETTDKLSKMKLTVNNPLENEKLTNPVQFVNNLGKDDESDSPSFGKPKKSQSQNPQQLEKASSSELKKSNSKSEESKG